MKPKFKVLALFILLFNANSLLATDHVILFGVGGFTYNPSNLTVNLGDNITFRGNFSSHPLSSTSVPQGAATFSNTTGSSDFTYTVTVAGNYAYQCDFHASAGMTGSFTVEDPSGIKLHAITPTAAAIYPTVTTDVVNIDLSGITKSDTRFSVEVFNLNGQQLIVEQKRNQSLIQVSLNNLSNGIYFIAVKQGGQWIISKRIIKG
jgi:plastocyanin